MTNDNAPPGVLTVTGLDHVVLRVRDASAMLAFYTDVLGCPVERTVDEIGLYQLRAGAALIDLMDVAGDLARPDGHVPHDPQRNMDHLCLNIDPWDEAAIRTHLAAHGISAGPTERRYGARGHGPSIYIEDPEGNVVERRGRRKVEGTPGGNYRSPSPPPSKCSSSPNRPST